MPLPKWKLFCKTKKKKGHLASDFSSTNMYSRYYYSFTFFQHKQVHYYFPYAKMSYVLSILQYNCSNTQHKIHES